MRSTESMSGRHCRRSLAATNPRDWWGEPSPSLSRFRRNAWTTPRSLTGRRNTAPEGVLRQYFPKEVDRDPGVGVRRGQDEPHFRKGVRELYDRGDPVSHCGDVAVD